MASLGELLHGLLLAILGSVLLTTLAMPPPPPVRCNQTGCTLSNSYGIWGDRAECHVSNVTYPSTEHELLLAVAQATQQRLKVKVVSKFSHTIPKWACPVNKPENAILISTEKYNKGIDVNVVDRTVTVDAGVGLRDLIDHVEAEGLSLVASPYWEGVSMGGVISTGAQGSSWWGKGGAVHDHVVGLSLVVPASVSEGYAKIIRLEAQDEMLNAAKLSLGLLGVISKVSLFSLRTG